MHSYYQGYENQPQFEPSSQAPKEQGGKSSYRRSLEYTKDQVLEILEVFPEAGHYRIRLEQQQGIETLFQDILDFLARPELFGDSKCVVSELLSRRMVFSKKMEHTHSRGRSSSSSKVRFEDDEARAFMYIQQQQALYEQQQQLLPTLRAGRGGSTTQRNDKKSDINEHEQRDDYEDNYHPLQNNYRSLHTSLDINEPSQSFQAPPGTFKYGTDLGPAYHLRRNVSRDDEEFLTADHCLITKQRLLRGRSRSSSPALFAHANMNMGPKQSRLTPSLSRTPKYKTGMPSPKSSVSLPSALKQKTPIQMDLLDHGHNERYPHISQIRSQSCSSLRSCHLGDEQTSARGMENDGVYDGEELYAQRQNQQEHRDSPSASSYQMGPLAQLQERSDEHPPVVDLTSSFISTFDGSDNKRQHRYLKTKETWITPVVDAPSEPPARPISPASHASSVSIIDSRPGSALLRPYEKQKETEEMPRTARNNPLMTMSSISSSGYDSELQDSSFRHLREASVGNSKILPHRTAASTVESTSSQKATTDRQSIKQSSVGESRIPFVHRSGSSDLSLQRKTTLTTEASSGKSQSPVEQPQLVPSPSVAPIPPFPESGRTLINKTGKSRLDSDIVQSIKEAAQDNRRSKSGNDPSGARSDPPVSNDGPQRDPDEGSVYGPSRDAHSSRASNSRCSSPGSLQPFEYRGEEFSAVDSCNSQRKDPEQQVSDGYSKYSKEEVAAIIAQAELLGKYEKASKVRSGQSQRCIKLSRPYRKSDPEASFSTRKKCEPSSSNYRKNTSDGGSSDASNTRPVHLLPRVQSVNDTLDSWSTSSNIKSSDKSEHLLRRVSSPGDEEPSHKDLLLESKTTEKTNTTTGVLYSQSRAVDGSIRYTDSTLSSLTERGANTGFPRKRMSIRERQQLAEMEEGIRKRAYAQHEAKLLRSKHTFDSASTFESPNQYNEVYHDDDDDDRIMSPSASSSYSESSVSTAIDDIIKRCQRSITYGRAPKQSR